MNYPRYPECKESGIEWLGTVPAHWNVVSIKWLSPVLRGASPRPIDNPEYFDDDGEYAWVRIADATASDGILLETTQRLSELGSSLSVKLQPNTLFVSIAGTVGKPCITGIKACIHDGFVHFPSLRIDQRFLFRIFEAGVCYGGLGKMGTQLNLNTDSIGSIRIAVPPENELKAILIFLEREIFKIDELAKAFNGLINLLKEKRQAVISHAVTKGLDPSVPMKDSGIEWLKEMPVNWTVLPIKRCCNLLKDGTHLPPARVADGVPLLSVRNVQKGAFGLLEDDSMISEDSYQDLCRSFIPQPNDVLLAIVGATLGKTALIPENLGNFHIQRSLAVFRTKEILSSKWLNYIFQSPNFQSLLWENIGFSAQPGIYLGTLSEVRIAVPPIPDQERIIAYLELEIGKIDVLMQEVQAADALLQERRTALISAAVTGKIDVRGLVTVVEEEKILETA